jgi:hypothetical protein
MQTFPVYHVTEVTGGAALKSAGTNLRCGGTRGATGGALTAKCSDANHRSEVIDRPFVTVRMVLSPSL